MLVDTMAMNYGRLPVDEQVAAFQAVRAWACACCPAGGGGCMPHTG